MLGFTSISISLGAVAVLQPVGPCALVFSGGRGALSDTVTTLETLRPLASVDPSTTRLDAQAVSLSILPLTLKG